MEPSDLHWMRLALAEAGRGRGAVEPNPMVGAAVVRDGRLVAQGHHARFGEAHAEAVALARAGEAARGATLYVTLEPCCHRGKTPPCAEAIVRAGIVRVVAAMRDPFPLVDGGGFARLREAGATVEVGLLGDEARWLNAPFLKRLATGRPFVTAKWAMTLDGKIATAGGDSRWISGEASRARVHEVRGRVDAVVIGIGTALADDPQLTARPEGPRRAVRVVLDSSGRLPEAGQLARTAGDWPVLVVVTDRASAERRATLTELGCDVLALPGDGPIPIAPLLDVLGRRGMTNVLVEGGGRVLGSFFDADEVDAVEVFIAPIVEGGSHSHAPTSGRGVERMAQAPRLDRREVERIGDDVQIRGGFARPWLALGSA